MSDYRKALVYEHFGTKNYKKRRTKPELWEFEVRKTCFRKTCFRKKTIQTSDLPAEIVSYIATSQSFVASK